MPFTHCFDVSLIGKEFTRTPALAFPRASCLPGKSSAFSLGWWLVVVFYFVLFWERVEHCGSNQQLVLDLRQFSCLSLLSAGIICVSHTGQLEGSYDHVLGPRILCDGCSVSVKEQVVVTMCRQACLLLWEDFTWANTEGRERERDVPKAEPFGLLLLHPTLYLSLMLRTKFSPWFYFCMYLWRKMRLKKEWVEYGCVCVCVYKYVYIYACMYVYMYLLPQHTEYFTSLFFFLVWKLMENFTSERNRGSQCEFFSSLLLYNHMPGPGLQSRLWHQAKCYKPGSQVLRKQRKQLDWCKSKDSLVDSSVYHVLG